MVRNGLALLFDAANYILPVLLVLYASTRPAKDSERDLWGRSLVWIAIGAAVYGWVQFIVMPGWDAFWMNNEHLRSIGKPVALEVRVYSTLNSPGPAGQFFAAGLAAMLVNKRWRGPLGWLGVALVASVLALTLVRTSWLTIASFVVVYAILTGGPSLKQLTISIGALIAVLYFMLPYLPGGDQIEDRVATMSNLNTDYSYNDRAQFTQEALNEYLSNPLGTGLGSTGIGTRLDNGGRMGEDGVFDNGFLALLLTFGTPGFLALCGFFYNLGRYLWQERLVDQSSLISAGTGLA
jgi:hypothetical protein